MEEREEEREEHRRAEEVFQEYVVQTYSCIARDFDRTRYKPWPEMLWLADILPARSKVLDVGSGNGRNAFFLASQGHEVVGVDVVEEMVVVARRKAESFGTSNPEFLVGDGRKLPFPDAIFDCVFSIATIHHIPSANGRMEALREMWRVLGSGGVCLLSVWGREQSRFPNAKSMGAEGDVFIPWKRQVDGREFQRYYHLFAKNELKALAGEAGMEGVVFSHAENQYFYGRKGEKVGLEDVPVDLREG
ncbi:MAG: class I SAM-dependent methyltransferase [Candidatus Thermoplasmatota archaeon]|nr:class I SAM-dependent methyltransferase [Candidatus Thermoplasmatota archaeon]